MELGPIQLAQKKGSVAGSCEHDKALSGSMKREVTSWSAERLSAFRDSVPRILMQYYIMCIV
jgi:hypothetical protein